MLVATVMLGVASEGSKKELPEWGDRQIRGNEGDGAKLSRVGISTPFRDKGTREILEFLDEHNDEISFRSSDFKSRERFICPFIIEIIVFLSRQLDT